LITKVTDTKSMGVL